MHVLLGSDEAQLQFKLYYFDSYVLLEVDKVIRVSISFSSLLVSSNSVLKRKLDDGIGTSISFCSPAEESKSGAFIKSADVFMSSTDVSDLLINVLAGGRSRLGISKRFNLSNNSAVAKDPLVVVVPLELDLLSRVP